MAFQERIIEVAGRMVHVPDALVFCNKYRFGVWDICSHPLCSNSRITVCDKTGAYIAGPGRCRVEYSGLIAKGYPVCSNGKGGIMVSPMSSSENPTIRELGFVLSICDGNEAEIFVNGVDGYFR